jgi:hypothetical protein
MWGLLRASKLTAALLLFPLAAAEAETAPDDTAAFVSYCTADANFEACRSKSGGHQ